MKMAINNALTALLVLAMLMIVCITTPIAVATDDWVVTTVDSNGGGVGFFTSMAIDSNDQPHISYFDRSEDLNQELKYARWTGSEWNVEKVDSSKEYDTHTSIAIDDSNNPHIVYYDNDGEVLKYAKLSGSDWSIEVVDQVGWDGGYPSLVLDSKGFPHIGYSENEDWSVKYARWTGSKWSYEEVDFFARYISLTLDSSDNPHISYHNDGLIYAGKINSSWSTEIVDTTMYAGWGGTDLAVDSQGNIHIGYTTQEDGDFNYARSVGSSWNIELLDSIDSRCDDITLCIDSENNPHLIYYKSESWTKGEMMYIHWTGTDWSSELITECNGGGYPVIEMDSKDDPHVCFYKGGTLVYTQKGLIENGGTGNENDKKDDESTDSLALLMGIVLTVVVILVVVILFFKKIGKKKPDITINQHIQEPAQPQPQPQSQPQSQPKSQQFTQQYPCQICQQPLSFIAQYQKWYCENCGRYV